MIERNTLYTCCLLTMLFISCGGIKTKLSKTDLKWMNVYNVGDTLIFQSDKGDLDSSFIIKKEVYYSDYNPVEVEGNYLPQSGVVWYKNKNLQYHQEGYKLIDITKEHPKKKTSLSINYLYSEILIANLLNPNVEQYKHGKVYEFDTSHPKGRPEQPKKIFWHEDFGVIKYITHAGVTWNRINLPQ